MIEFCEDPLWDSNRIWNTTNPFFTSCFEDTVIKWIPCLFLWLFTPFEIYRIRHSDGKCIPWTIANIFKIMLLFLLVINSLLEMSFALIRYSHEQIVYPVEYYSPFIMLITFILVLVLVLYQRKKGIHSSGVLFIFWLLMSFAMIIKYRTIIMTGPDSDSMIWSNKFLFVIKTIYIPLVIAELVMCCFADTKSEYLTSGVNFKKICPADSASFLSFVTFWWVNELVILGVKRPLKQFDIWHLSLKYKTVEVLKRFSKMWNRSKAKQSKEKEPNATWILVKTFWPQLLLAAVFHFVESVLIFVNPIILDNLITFVSSSQPTWRGYFFVLLLLVTDLTNTLFTAQYQFQIYATGLRIRSCLISSIYRKSLKLSSSGRQDFTTGEIVNLMAVDTQRVIDYVFNANLLWSAPLQVSVAFYMLWGQLGIATLSGFLIMVLLVPLNGFVTVKLRKLQGAIMKNKDKRTKLMSEILNGIKVLKLYAWETSFLNTIKSIRSSEIKSLKKLCYYFAGLIFAFSSTPFLVSLASFATYVLISSSNILDPNKAFVSLTLFNIMRLPLARFPLTISQATMFLVSMRRINKYLQGDELDPSAITHHQDPNHCIKMSNASFSWSKNDKPFLRDIDLEIKRNKLIAVVGQVGSGKSSLLSALLGDMYKTKGSVNISGKVAYVPQQAWIMNETVQKNILFVKPMEESKYRKVLKACALEPDLKILEGGDLCEIGEKGINLSGGQKQRISLARAVYSDSDIYFLDDPLSAVDANVSSHIFKYVIGPSGLLKNKTRILVTHRLTLLPDVDEIIVLKDGSIAEKGSYTELLEKKGEFAEILAQFLYENLEEEMSEEEAAALEAMRSSVEPILDRRWSSKSDSISSSVSLRQRKSSLVRSRSIEQSRKSISKGKLIEAEAQEAGSIKLSVYKQYIVAIGVCTFIISLFSFVGTSGFNIASSLWLSEWSNDATDPKKATDTRSRDIRLGVYGLLGFGEVLCSLLQSIILNLACLNAAKSLHNIMIDRILFAPMSFFDTTPMGRILNRFTKDIETVDSTIWFNVRMSISQFFRTISSLILISLETPLFLIAVVPLGILYYIIQKFYVTTSRQLNRIEATTRSPVYSHFSETVTGTTSIRAYGAVKPFIEECHSRIDTNHSAYFAFISANRWLETRLEFLGLIIAFLAAIFAVIFRDTISPGLAGVSISYALTITDNLNLLVRSTSDVETNMVSVERCFEYSKTPLEAPHFIADRKPKPNWPKQGNIQFENYSTRYREGLKLVLKQINCKIKSGEKVGIVGRTGAGKSSLTLALFRIIEPVEGTILIDDLDISKIGLSDLRSRLTIIPQDPVLFTGTLRMNLDPFSSYSDDQIWESLELAHLKSFVESLDAGLSYEIAEGGENLSVGQRQLVCLARALLRKSKILVLDEATAAIDFETDELIQSTIRKEFSDCSIVTIAHRLNTIMDYDKILVIDSGQIAEFDSPKALLEDPQSIFYSMAKDAGLV